MNSSTFSLVVNIVGFFIFSTLIFHEVNAQNLTSNIHSDVNQLKDDLSSKAQTALNQTVNSIKSQISSLANKSLDNAGDVASKVMNAVAPVVNKTQELAGDFKSALPKIKNNTFSAIDNALNESGLENPIVKDFVKNGAAGILNITQKIADGLQSVLPMDNNALGNAGDIIPEFINKTQAFLQDTIQVAESGVTSLLNKTVENAPKI